MALSKYVISNTYCHTGVISSAYDVSAGVILDKSIYSAFEEMRFPFSITKGFSLYLSSLQERLPRASEASASDSHLHLSPIHLLRRDLEAGISSDQMALRGVIKID